MQELRKTEKQTDTSSEEMDYDIERKKEEEQLEKCITVIKQNIEDYLEKYKELSAETKELYDTYREDSPQMYNNIMSGFDQRSMIERILYKNRRALKKPYFGRIDYKEIEENDNFSLYIGKNGIRKNTSESMIVDWRAPVASVYYDSEIGKSSYLTPSGEAIDIDLKLKRTYEISDSKLIDYYDANIVSNDEFLTKHLSKSKEVVLDEIIATIQKEQNEIIRDNPWHNVLVQGVAGSGKTTVAMHRISYILYNFKEKFRPDEFFIIGSNKMLLNYITGVLPNLDVYNVNQMTMEDFLLLLLDKDFQVTKGKYQFSNSFTKRRTESQSKEESELKRFKGSLDFIKALDAYMRQFEMSVILSEDVSYENSIVYSKEEIQYFLNFFQDKPLQEKVDLLNKKLAYKIKSVNEEKEKRKEEIAREVNRYKNYFGNRHKKYNLMECYLGFLEDLIQSGEQYRENGLRIPTSEVIELLVKKLSAREIDLYDLAMLTFIKRRIKWTRDFEYVRHIVIDEAQDFGVMIFALFQHLFHTCSYTIMGDITQNINYDSGMNDWETLKNEVLNPDKDKFYVLAKSYRNTVEISNYASRILKKCSFTTYDIEPVIRHGKEVSVIEGRGREELVSHAVDIITAAQANGYDTIAVICRSVEETLQIKELLKPYITIQHVEDDMENVTFTTGVMVLPIYMTKGLEFDAVILWNPDELSYRTTDEDAKLLYVAVTRALHELHILYQGKLSGLLL